MVAVDGIAAGIVAVADPIKESATVALAALRDESIRVVMLTGDSRSTAEAVGRRLGIGDIVADVLPDQKARVVRDLQAKGRFVAMAGDGINDAPALAQAQVGIAMGTGADVAMESAAVTLVKGDLQGIVRARRLSRAVMRNIRQNLFFAFVFQRRRNSDCGRGALSGVRAVAQPDDRQRRNEPEFSDGDRQRLAPALGAALAEHKL